MNVIRDSDLQNSPILLLISESGSALGDILSLFIMSVV